MAVYVLNTEGTRQALLEVLTLPEDLPAGHASDTIERTWSRADIGAGLELVAGDDGSSTIDPADCNPDNNAATFTP